MRLHAVIRSVGLLCVTAMPAVAEQEEAAAPETGTVEVVVDLIDGSRVVGKLDAPPLKIESSGGVLTVPWKDICSLELVKNAKQEPWNSVLGSLGLGPGEGGLWGVASPQSQSAPLISVNQNMGEVWIDFATCPASMDGISFPAIDLSAPDVLAADLLRLSELIQSEPSSPVPPGFDLLEIGRPHHISVQKEAAVEQPVADGPVPRNEKTGAQTDSPAGAPAPH